MLRENINKEIADAMKSKDSNRLYVLKMIKAKFLEYKTSKRFKESDFNDAKEISILMKMEKTWQDERDMFIKANRDVTELTEQLNILQSFLPKVPSQDELKQAIIDSGYEPKPQNMKYIMGYVKDKYPAADGSKVIEIIRQMK